SGWVEEPWIKIGALQIELRKRRVIANTQSVVNSEVPPHFPRILPIPLHLSQLEISKRTRLRLRVISEITDERVGISVAGIPKSRGESTVVTGKVEHPGPLPARGFPIKQPLIIHAKLVIVIP